MGFEGSGIETKLQQETEARKRIEQMLQVSCNLLYYFCWTS
uniref:Uncharacterized protein n=1 Tax=Leersia perrieri TaxID=77586 RepID=A0A0D9XBB8_9ORYZ